MNEPGYSPSELLAMASQQLGGMPPVTQHPPEPAGVPPVDWRNLSGEDAQNAWEELRKWVEWFTVRYNVPVSIVPACWWRHGALVEELSALHILHKAAFDPADTGFGPIGWHERLAAAQPRLRQAGAGCSSSHNEHRPRSWVAQTDEAAWAAWITESHAH
ncbi:hypothetical protein ACWKWN_13500 [Microbacterium trichothecenolyticum]